MNEDPGHHLITFWRKADWGVRIGFILLPTLLVLLGYGIARPGLVMEAARGDFSAFQGDRDARVVGYFFLPLLLVFSVALAGWLYGFLRKLAAREIAAAMEDSEEKERAQVVVAPPVELAPAWIPAPLPPYEPDERISEEEEPPEPTDKIQEAPEMPEILAVPPMPVSMEFASPAGFRGFPVSKFLLRSRRKSPG